MEKEITSKNNALIKDLAKLTIKKYRKEQNLVLVEGERFVGDLVARGVEIKYLLYREKPAFAEKLDAEQILCSEEVLNCLTQTVNSSQIVGVVRLTAKPFRLPKSQFLVLDRVADPGNLGTIIRTALALGYKDIYMFNCVDWTNDKVLRSTMGTIADVNLFEVTMEDLQKLRGLTIYNADMNGVDIDSIKKPKGIFGIILGNEANGASAEIASLASQNISIKMQNAVESLNVAIAGAIIMSKLI